MYEPRSVAQGTSQRRGGKMAERRAKSPNAQLSAVKTLAGRTFCSKSAYCVGMSSIKTCAGSKRSLMLRSMQYERAAPRLPFVEQ